MQLFLAVVFALVLAFSSGEAVARDGPSAYDGVASPWEVPDAVNLIKKDDENSKKYAFDDGLCKCKVTCACDRSKLCPPPTGQPTSQPTSVPSPKPSKSTSAPSHAPTYVPTFATRKPSTHYPTLSPTKSGTDNPTVAPTFPPTSYPTLSPTYLPTPKPTRTPTFSPSKKPSVAPTTAASTLEAPTRPPLSPKPTERPSRLPTAPGQDAPTRQPQASTYPPIYWGDWLAPSDAPTKAPVL